MHATVSVWDDGPTYTHRQGALVTSASNGTQWRIQLPRAATSGWPDDVTGHDCLLTTEEDEHIDGVVKDDTTSDAKRYLRIPRDGDNRSRAAQLKQVGYGSLP